MEDRELLELAGKSAGITVKFLPAWGGGTASFGDGHYWNPLTNDADALQLAVKLELDIRHTPGSTHVFRHQTHLSSEHHGQAIVRCRKAIVRAAAEIGRAMP